MKRISLAHHLAITVLAASTVLGVIGTRATDAQGSRAKQVSPVLKTTFTIAEFRQPNDSDWTAAFQRAFDTLAVHGGYGGVGAVLEVPPGEYRIRNTLRIERDGDADVRFTVRCPVQRGASIIQTNGSAGVMSIGTSRHNLRGLTLEGLSFQRGTYGLRVVRAFYSRFNDLSFQQQSEASILAESSGPTPYQFNDPWIVHTSGDAIVSRNSWVMVQGGKIGEDVGSIVADDGEVHLIGSVIWSKPGFGREAVFVVKAGGQVYAESCHITVYQGEHLFSLNSALPCRVYACRIMKYGSGELVENSNSSGVIEVGNDHIYSQGP